MERLVESFEDEYQIYEVSKPGVDKIWFTVADEWNTGIRILGIPTLGEARKVGRMLIEGMDYESLWKKYPRGIQIRKGPGNIYPEERTLVFPFGEKFKEGMYSSCRDDVCDVKKYFEGSSISPEIAAHELGHFEAWKEGHPIIGLEAEKEAWRRAVPGLKRSGEWGEATRFRTIKSLQSHGASEEEASDFVSSFNEEV